MKAIIVLLLLLGNTVLYAQDCDCKKKLDSVTTYLRKNYVGFIDKVNPATQQSYISMLTRVSAQASIARSYAHCVYVINSYLQFFKDRHLYLSTAFGPKRESITIPAAQLKLLEQQPVGGVTGIYKSDSLEIALVKQPKGIRTYAAIILPPGTASWKPNDILFELVSRGAEKFDIINYARWEQKQFDSLKINKTTNELFHYGWGKQQVNSTVAPSKVPAFADEPENISFFKQLDDSTGYLRIRSFALSHYGSIDSVINANDDYIRKNSKLIIDIRGCDSGNYKLAERLRPLLYTQPVRLVGVDFFATPDNVAAWRQLLEAQATQLPDEYVEQIKEVLQQSSGLQGRLVSMGPDENMILPSPTTFPEKVAIIIDETCKETAEQFLLEAKQSTKVKLYGVPTTGMLDYSHPTNVKFFAPNFLLVYPVTRSRRISANQGIDNKGVVPDYVLDYFKPGWLYEVQKN
ncbi:hypothetical protein DVR12_25650 [Chitinophaga silvatica]|uniref:Tail specific protease domain-containing protein n=1 Tax=Chitinophaga silvatica TaxID=2282649 RepID=A0A3E1Y2R0_9BACT|nr:S41 family peptidase [Chitinophaga silvatica]RFS18990.1 hypothetical protein DVR12_25650 [Chitinophaga silvatica]